MVSISDLSGAQWRKSSYCGDDGGECIECIECAALGGTEWRKSSHSEEVGDCVEIATAPHAVAIRDSKDPGGPVLTFSPASFAAFVAAAAGGDFRATD
ncbi:DUF397 domain-containing protein [Streptomyces sp. NPDC051776]|uniref:DUF397 domain-containing protein n=1 Tax=Streptomyces sp. NPDC051776 TaxID=3155414 RepID=UPI0034322C66